jgi:type IV pilus assembly protein PilB
LGVADFNVASSVVLICAQRLVRKLCPHCKCKVPHENRYTPVGCANCVNGYKGRVGIHQVLPMTADLQQMMLSGLDTLSIANRLKQNGVLTLREAGLMKACAGITSHEEVWAATSS